MEIYYCCIIFPSLAFHVCGGVASCEIAADPVTSGGMISGDFFFSFSLFLLFSFFFYWCHTTSGPSSFKLGSEGGNGTWKKKKKGEKRCVELAECERGKGKYILGRMHTNKGRRFRGNR